MAKRILIVEDEQFLLKMYKEILESVGYQVVTAIDGQEGLSKAENEQPLDLIITCILLPKMDGVELIRRLKDNKKTRKIPIIVCTNMRPDSIMAEVYRLGAVGFLQKSSMAIDQFLPAIKEYLDTGKFTQPPQIEKNDSQGNNLSKEFGIIIASDSLSLTTHFYAHLNNLNIEESPENEKVKLLNLTSGLIVSNVFWFKIYIECVYFFLHLTDRFVFEDFKSTKRDEIMFEVEKYTLSAILYFLPREKRTIDITNEFLKNYSQTMREYGKYKVLLPQGDKSLKGTLLWEFGKKIAGLLGKENFKINLECINRAALFTKDIVKFNFQLGKNLSNS